MRMCDHFGPAVILSKPKDQYKNNVVINALIWYFSSGDDGRWTGSKRLFRLCIMPGCNIPTAAATTTTSYVGSSPAADTTTSIATGLCQCGFDFTSVDSCAASAASL